MYIYSRVMRVHIRIAHTCARRKVHGEKLISILRSSFNFCQTFENAIPIVRGRRDAGAIYRQRTFRTA